jgi:hypothetical protein
MTGREIRHCEVRSAVAIHAACGLAHFALNAIVLTGVSFNKLLKNA